MLACLSTETAAGKSVTGDSDFRIRKIFIFVEESTLFCNISLVYLNWSTLQKAVLVRVIRGIICLRKETNYVASYPDWIIESEVVKWRFNEDWRTLSLNRFVIKMSSSLVVGVYEEVVHLSLGLRIVFSCLFDEDIHMALQHQDQDEMKDFYWLWAKTDCNYYFQSKSWKFQFHFQLSIIYDQLIIISSVYFL